MTTGFPIDGIRNYVSTKLIAFTAAIVLIALINVLIKVSRKKKDGRAELLLAFFHPYCDSGGGGERVLWVMINALLKDKSISSRLQICIYSSVTSRTKSEILAGVNNSFRIDITDYFDKITFVPVYSSPLLDAKWYTVATMLCQSLASVLVGMECVIRCRPDIYCDTMGAAFTYPFAKFATHCHIVAYKHYPIISSDMLQRVRDQRPTYNGGATISGHISISSAKLIYYKMFAHAYTFVGSFADTVMVNSSWTESHFSQLWKLDIVQNISEPCRSESVPNIPSNDTNSKSRRKKLLKVFPPCNTQHLQEIPLGDLTSRRRIILSIGQFRPEKDHHLQLRAMRALLDLGDRFSDVKLVMVGSTRNEEDRALVKSLKDVVSTLAITDNVVFVVNAPFTELHSWLCCAQVGLHTMWNEHFGISVVEMMAAGLITVAHNSGGPKLDLISSAPIPSDEHIDPDPTKEVSTTGYLATTASQYAQCLHVALDTYNDSLTLRQRARKSSLRFSDEEFTTNILQIFTRIVIMSASLCVALGFHI